MKSSLFSLGLGILLLHGCVAQIEQQGGGWQSQQHQPQRRYQAGQSQCQIENLNAQEPNTRFESEAGVTEFWDQNNEQFNCAGRGMTGALIPGCPETYHSIQQSQRLRERGRQQRPMDQHRKIRQIKQGDIVALPTGVAHWCYNEGETPLFMVVVHDKFQLAGSQQTQTGSSYQQQQQLRGQQEIPTNIIFNGFDVETLAEAFGVSTETARRLQGQNDQRGNIAADGEEKDSEEQYPVINGLEETICSMRLKQNIANQTHADIYSENDGKTTILKSQKLPILNYIQMSAERGVLYQNALTNDNAMMSPLVGKSFALRAMPADVLMNAYQISREEANRLKNNRREETLILTPGSSSQVRLLPKSEKAVSN
ncbi:hypothetical protein MKX01_031284 [Papaver californicum]|nr:hypothetical protein MKX01_031284 [Papaver californicum]